MLNTMWSPKGGVGLSVTAAATAALYAKRDGTAVLVHLCGDQPALLGLRDPKGPGVFDWLASEGASAESLNQLLVECPAGVELLPMGDATTWHSERGNVLGRALGSLSRTVIIDAGVQGWTPNSETVDQQDTSSVSKLRSDLVSSLIDAGRSILVTSACYLALRRAVRMNLAESGLIVVSDPGRALNGRDVSSVLGHPLLAQIERDPAVSRSVDAGMFLRRPNRSLESALKDLL
ncbi:MAG TPA: hypothetical protein VL068_03215 [Microthrixaceae bacterium]|nr:hypothetical protein [Microthrixaceae bacterium]